MIQKVNMGNIRTNGGVGNFGDLSPETQKSGKKYQN